MQKRRYIAYFCIALVLVCMSVLSLVMTWPRYQKTTEQLPELISDNSVNLNPALLQIRSQLDAIESEAALSGKNSRIIWTGSVCASKYTTLSGSMKVYYVCPYIILEENVSPSGETNWTFCLQFAVSTMSKGQLTDSGSTIKVLQNEFSLRVNEDALITGAGFGDGQMLDSVGKSVSNSFRDRNDIVNMESFYSSIRLVPDGSETADASVMIKALAEKTEENCSSAVLSWSFMVMENGHGIGYFEDNQVEIPYTLVKADQNAQKEEKDD